MNRRKETEGKASSAESVAKADAHKRFLDASLPSPKEETWRFTHPELLFDEQTQRLLEQPPVEGNGEALPALPELDFLVLADDATTTAETAPLPDGVSFETIAQAEVSWQESEPPDKFDLLIAARASNRVALMVSKDAELPFPLLLRSFLPAGSLKAAVGEVNLGANAKAQLVLWLDGGSDRARYFSRHLFKLASGANLSATIVQQADESARLLQRLRFELAESAQLRLTIINLGSQVVRQELHLDIAGAQAKAEIRGFAFARGKQHFALHSTQVHRAPQAESHLRYKQVLLDESRGVFDGMVQVLPEMHGTDAYQECHTLLLSEQARVHAIPRLEICTHDVRCGHGATVKRLSPVEVFYLRSRGLREVTAKRLLTAGFLKEVIAGLEPAALSEHLEAMLDVRLDGYTAH